jgi:hypothetical protein
MVAWRINGRMDKDSLGVIKLDPTANATSHTSLSGVLYTIAMGPNPRLTQYVFVPDD